MTIHDRDPSLDPEALDRRLRAALEPPPATVARVVSRARAARPRRRWPRLVAAAALGVALLATLLERQRHPPHGPEQAPEPATLRITNEAGAVVVTASDGSQWMLISRTGDPS